MISFENECYFSGVVGVKCKLGVAPTTHHTHFLDSDPTPSAPTLHPDRHPDAPKKSGCEMGARCAWVAPKTTPTTAFTRFLKKNNSFCLCVERHCSIRQQVPVSVLYHKQFIHSFSPNSLTLSLYPSFEMILNESRRSAVPR